MDHAKARKELQERTALIVCNVRYVPGVEVEIVVQEVGNHISQLRVWWDQNKVNITIDEVINRFESGQPSVEILKKGGGLGEGLFVDMWMARPG